MERPQRPAAQAWSDDDELAGEIELYGDLVVAASSQEEPLTPLEIDSALGLEDSTLGLDEAAGAQVDDRASR